MIAKQKPVLTYACLDSDFIDGYPPITFNGVAIRNDAICEVMNDTTKQIYNMYKMLNGQWCEYVVGETASFDPLNVQWVGYPESPVLTSEYPSQIIGLDDDGITKLYCSTQSIQYFLADANTGSVNTTPNFMENVPCYHLLIDEWLLYVTQPLNKIIPPFELIKSNRDIIIMQSGFTVFPKTI